MYISDDRKDRLSDYFDAHELVSLLGLTTRDIIEAFEGEVEEALDDLEEIMGVQDD